MERMNRVEEALAWSFGQSYSFARQALNEYVCQFKDLQWYTDYQSIIYFKKRGIIGTSGNQWLCARHMRGKLSHV